MRIVRLCLVSLGVGLAVLAGARQARAQDRPKNEVTPQVPHPSKTTAAFFLPLVDNWKPDVVGRNGMYRFRQTNGNCQLTFVQGRGADAARAAGKGPQNTLDTYIDGVAARIGKLTRNKTPTLQLPHGNWVNPHAGGAKVTFISEEIAYTGKDNVAYHNRISVQWMDDVELLIIAARPSAEWNRSQDLLKTFLNKVSITATADQK